MLKEFSLSGLPPAIPITNYRIKGTITDWSENSFTNTNYFLTPNGNMSDGSGVIPDYWTAQGGDTYWTWDQANGTLECDGTPDSIYQKLYNNNENRDIEAGKDYRLRYTVGNPAGGSMQGKVVVYLFDQEGDGGNRELIASHESIGVFEPIITWTGDTPSPYSHAYYKNCIQFSYF